MNLFVVFDPVSVLGIQFNWISLVGGGLFLPVIFWVVPSRFFMLWELVIFGLLKEIGALYVKGFKGVGLILVVLFCFVVMNNFLGLFPFIFTATSHLVITLALGVVFWVSLMVYGWLNSVGDMLAHLVPLGTPAALMMFMVLIETVSNLIRPVTLSVRLAANMIAGHLLVVLLGSVIVLSGVVFVVGLFSLSLLFLLEIAVAFIQAYVFMILVGLYSTEV